MRTNIHVIAAAALLAAACGGAGQNASAQNTGVETKPRNATALNPAFAGQTRAPAIKSDVTFDVVTVAEGINNGWAFEFLPDGRIILTEKLAGAVRIVGKDGKLSPPVTGLPPVMGRSQGGLLDIALDPDYAANNLVYWSYSEPGEEGVNNTAVARGKLVDGDAPKFEDVKVIYRQAPSMASALHFGSRLVFGRDKTLFVTQGERSILPGRAQSQQMDSLLGKIVRINRDGTIPADNPFVGKAGVRPEIWSFGNRNSQGATLHPVTGELWETEHGPMGGDELNVIRKGKDYGWPTISYGLEYSGQPIAGSISAKDGMEQPIYYWDPIIGPGGMTFYTGDKYPAWKNNLFIGSMPGNHLIRLTVDGDKVTGEERLITDIGQRVRDVVQGPDGLLYILTENRAGKIVKLVPKG